MSNTKENRRKNVAYQKGVKDWLVTTKPKSQANMWKEAQAPNQNSEIDAVMKLIANDPF